MREIKKSTIAQEKEEEKAESACQGVQEKTEEKAGSKNQVLQGKEEKPEGEGHLPQKKLERGTSRHQGRISIKERIAQIREKPNRQVTPVSKDRQKGACL